MGIKDLLRALQAVTQMGSIDSYKGSRIAIDASGWLHKGLYSAAEDFVDSGFRDAQLYVDFIVSRARNFRNCGVEPVLVFDGKRNNLKSETNSKREEMRASNMQQGRRLIESIRATSDGACRQKLRMEAIACFQRGMAVTHEMELHTIAALRKLGITVIVAPYEADAQLAYLCHIGYCQAILTEDSDVLVYSAICGRPFDILYKFDKGGAVQRINLHAVGAFSTEEGDSDSPRLSQLSQSSSSSSSKANNEESGRGGSEKGFLTQLQNFRGTKGQRMFVQMCVLAGCDYCDSIHGVGLQTALQAVLRYKDCRDDDRLKRICTHFKGSGKNVLETYLSRAQRAEALFHYHPVYNPRTKSVVPFIPHNLDGATSINSADDALDTDVQIVTHPRSHGTGTNTSTEGRRECVGPSISEASLLQLGSAAEILRNAPAGVTIADICEGRVSFKTFEEITPRYPWEDQSIAQAANKGGYGGMWATRRGLVQALSMEAGRSKAPFHGATHGHTHGRTQGATHYGSQNQHQNQTYAQQKWKLHSSQQQSHHHGASHAMSSAPSSQGTAGKTGTGQTGGGGAFFKIISSQPSSQPFGNSRQPPVIKSAWEVYGSGTQPKSQQPTSTDARTPKNPAIDLSLDEPTNTEITHIRLPMKHTAPVVAHSSTSSQQPPRSIIAPSPVSKESEYADVLRSGMDPTAETVRTSSPSFEPQYSMHTQHAHTQTRKPLGDLPVNSISVANKDGSEHTLNWTNQHPKKPRFACSTTPLNPFGGLTVSPPNGSAMMTKPSPATVPAVLGTSRVALVTPTSEHAPDSFIDLSGDSSVLVNSPSEIDQTSSDFYIGNDGGDPTATNRVIYVDQQAVQVSAVGPKDTPALTVATGSLGIPTFKKQLSYASPAAVSGVTTTMATAVPASVTPSPHVGALHRNSNNVSNAHHGQKRKFEAVAISGGPTNASARGSNNKKAKTTIMVASIKSFFAPK